MKRAESTLGGGHNTLDAIADSSNKKSMPVNSAEAREWVSRRPTSRRRLLDGALYIYHHSVPKMMGAKITLWGVLAFMIFSLLNLAIVLTPLWGKAITPNGVDAGKLGYTEILAAGVVAFLLAFRWLLRRVSERATDRAAIAKARTNLAVYQAEVFERIRQQVRPLNNHSARERLEDALGSVLRCIENVVRIEAEKSDENYFSVSLFLFRGQNGEIADLVARSQVGRGSITGLPAGDLIAYYVAERGSEFAVLDFKHQSVFPKLRPGTSDWPPYRSIFFLPVVDHSTPDARRMCRAVVTIDSAVPYEFWGERRKRIFLIVRPYLRLVDLLLSRHTGGVSLNV